MALHLPTLAALRAFQSTARHLSFTKAAEELCITQSAISHQIRGLEEQLGAPLFLRGAKSVALTARGQRYLNQIAPLLDQLTEATREIAGEGVSGVLTILVPPVFAAKWLLPRLDRFKKSWPDIELRILSQKQATNEQNWDIRINCGYQMPPSQTEEPFLFTTRTPVCSPDLLQSGDIKQIADLLSYPILRDRERDGWQDWFDRQGRALPSDLNEIWLDDGYQLVTAAEAGQGIALGYSVLIEDALKTGRLIRLFDADSAPVLGYSVTFSALSGRSQKVMAFRDWFARETEALPDSAKLATLPVKFPNSLS